MYSITRKKSKHAGAHTFCTFRLARGVSVSEPLTLAGMQIPVPGRMVRRWSLPRFVRPSMVGVTNHNAFKKKRFPALEFFSKLPAPGDFVQHSCENSTRTEPVVLK